MIELRIFCCVICDVNSLALMSTILISTVCTKIDLYKVDRTPIFLVVTPVFLGGKLLDLPCLVRSDRQSRSSLSSFCFSCLYHYRGGGAGCDRVAFRVSDPLPAAVVAVVEISMACKGLVFPSKLA